MTHEWKPGAGPGPWPAMVMVRNPNAAGVCCTETPQGGAHPIPLAALHPLPPSLSPEQAAVIEAAEYLSNSHGERINESSLIAAVQIAVRALHASLAPRDPVAEVKAAFANYDAACSQLRPATGDEFARLRAAIAALSERGV